MWSFGVLLWYTGDLGQIIITESVTDLTHCLQDWNYLAGDCMELTLELDAGKHPPAPYGLSEYSCGIQETSVKS